MAGLEFPASYKHQTIQQHTAWHGLPHNGQAPGWWNTSEYKPTKTREWWEWNRQKWHDAPSIRKSLENGKWQPIFSTVGLSILCRRKLARPRRNELQYHRGVRLPTCFGLLSSCCVQFSLLISSGCQQWPIIFMQHDLRLHIICWPYTSLHRIAYKVLSSPSQRRRAQNKSAKQPETVWLKRTDCPICPILYLGSFALQSGAVASELRNPWDCRRHKF